MTKHLNVDECFERWAKIAFPICYRYEGFPKYDDGSYKDVSINCAYRAWHASLECHDGLHEDL
jgi:hypothetical protein